MFSSLHFNTVCSAVRAGEKRRVREGEGGRERERERERDRETEREGEGERIFSKFHS